MQLKQKQAVIHQHGATFAFEPVGNTGTQVMLERTVRPDGSIRWSRGQEIGPFGNLSIGLENIEAINPEWRELAKDLIYQAHLAILWLEGFNPDWWQPEVTDFTAQPAETEGGDTNEEVKQTATDTITTIEDQDDDN